MSKDRPVEQPAFERTWSDAESPAIAVVEAVSAVTGQDPTEMSPLHDAVDADALNELIRTGDGVCVTFSYGGTTVTVESDGSVVVTADGAACPED
jgi:hypothetical protein